MRIPKKKASWDVCCGIYVLLECVDVTGFLKPPELCLESERIPTKNPKMLLGCVLGWMVDVAEILKKKPPGFLCFGNERIPKKTLLGCVRALRCVRAAQFLQTTGFCALGGKEFLKIPPVFVPWK